MLATLVICCLTVHAEKHGEEAEQKTVVEVPQWMRNIRLSGYGMVPVIKNKLQLKARYQTYRVSKQWGSSKSLYEVGVNYFICKNLQLNFEYARLNDRTRDRHNYNLMDVQLDFRF